MQEMQKQIKSLKMEEENKRIEEEKQAKQAKKAEKLRELEEKRQNKNELRESKIQKQQEEREAKKQAKMNAKPINDMSEYFNMKTEFEKSWFRLKNPVCYVEQKADGALILRDRMKASEAIRHLRVNITTTKGDTVTSKTVPFFNLWIDDETIRRYEELGYYPPPTKCPENVFNTYIDPSNTLKGKIVDISDFHEHLRCLTNFDERCYRYLIYYLADMVQNAGVVMRSHGTCIVFRGEQGAQKGNLEKIMNGVLGKENVVLTSDLNSVIPSETNRFADRGVDKILVILDEANSKDAYNYADKLKSFITSEKIAYEKKNIQGMFETPFYARTFAFTNHSNSIKIECSDRRFTVFNTSTKYAGEAGQRFGERLNKHYKDNDFVHSVRQYLMNVKFPEKFNFKLDRPLTDAYHAMKAHNIPHVCRYIAECIENGMLKHKAQNFFDGFLTFINNNNFQTKYTSVSFANSIKELGENAGIKKGKASSIYYQIDPEQFKEYCKIKKYNIFEDDEEEKPKTYYAKSLKHDIQLKVTKVEKAKPFDFKMYCKRNEPEVYKAMKRNDKIFKYFEEQMDEVMLMDTKMQESKYNLTHSSSSDDDDAVNGYYSDSSNDTFNEVKEFDYNSDSDDGEKEIIKIDVSKCLNYFD